jgi:hypothetical protein
MFDGLIFDKKVGLPFGGFFIHSSGHPDAIVKYRAEKIALFARKQHKQSDQMFFKKNQIVHFHSPYFVKMTRLTTVCVEKVAKRFYKNVI